MKCLKISHRVILSSLFALFALPFLFSSGRASASSQSFSYDSSSDPKPQQVFWTADNSYNGLTFTPTYVVIEGEATRNDTQISIGRVSPFAFGSYQSFYIVPDSSNHFYAVLNIPWGLNGQFSYISSITYTFYDYNPAINEPCPECPEVPEETEVLLDIKKSILFIPAMIFVIYLFYILYSFYIGGSR